MPSCRSGANPSRPPKRVVVALLLIVGIALAVAGAAPHPATRQPAKNPSNAAGSAPAAAAKQAVESDALGVFAATFDRALKAALVDVKDVDAGRVAQLAAYREFGRYFAALRPLRADQKENLAWLASQPRLLVPLTLAVADQDDPARVIGVLASLRKAFGDAIADAPDLTTAFCVVWDDPPQPSAPLDDGEGHITKIAPTPATPKTTPPPQQRNENRTGPSRRARPGPAPSAGDVIDEDTQRLLTLYRYYTAGRGQLQVDPTALPWQLAVYVVDNPVGKDELQWVQSRYRGKSFNGRVYHEVNYDLNAYYTGQSQKRGNRPYTLANIQRFGGVCKDQAYYAAGVAKSLGIPATVCTGSGGTGRGAHAWIGFLQTWGTTKNNPVWNFNEGRYEEHLYWSGAVVDPQTGAVVTDADVELLAELLDATPQNRLASVALWKSRDLVEPDRHADLYAAAINLASGNRNAWLGLAELGATGKLSDAQADEVSRVVNKFAVKEYPDFAFEVCRKMAAGRPPAERLGVLQKMEALFPRRPDLVATLRVERGDLLREQGRKDEALQAYLDVVGRDVVAAAPVMLTAMQRVDALLREANQVQRLADLYDQTWQKLPIPDPGAFANTAPYYKIGQRYADLLEGMGRQPAAAQIRERLARLLGGEGDEGQ